MKDFSQGMGGGLGVGAAADPATETSSGCSKKPFSAMFSVSTPTRPSVAARLRRRFGGGDGFGGGRRAVWKPTTE